MLLRFTRGVVVGIELGAITWALAARTVSGVGPGASEAGNLAGSGAASNDSRCSTARSRCPSGPLKWVLLLVATLVGTEGRDAKLVGTRNTKVPCLPRAADEHDQATLKTRFPVTGQTANWLGAPGRIRTCDLEIRGRSFASSVVVGQSLACAGTERVGEDLLHGCSSGRLPLICGGKVGTLQGGSPLNPWSNDPSLSSAVSNARSLLCAATEHRSAHPLRVDVSRCLSSFRTRKVHS
ncbi:hypothetical protein SAMN04487820_110272 [Actinopolyspora mzabensis]|uniref:Uncharacterized protein n=1 Tax=Actinopolyspora mzabensis TaxID=995066 RepID=A0A1G9DSE6_ACTMZ|nr:hypothetical protein SAMN04487820_110272 [Actinopolyspora mzabensis]